MGFLTVKQWQKIKKLGTCACSTDCICRLQSRAVVLKQENWYKYQNAFYSLIYNQVACVWKQEHNGEDMFAFRYSTITQDNVKIEYFKTIQDLICRYEQLIIAK